MNPDNQKTTVPTSGIENESISNVPGVNTQNQNAPNSYSPPAPAAQPVITQPVSYNSGSFSGIGGNNNKKILIVSIVALVLLVSGGGAYAALSYGKDSNNSESANTQTSDDDDKKKESSKSETQAEEPTIDTAKSPASNATPSGENQLKPYPEATRQAFIKQNSGINGGTAKEATCLIDQIQLKFTLEEFNRIYANRDGSTLKEYDEMTDDAYDECYASGRI